MTQSWQLTLRCPSGRVVPLPVVPVSAVTSATADDAAIDVTLQGDAVLLPGESSQELIISYTAGYGGAADVPADLKQAVLLLVAYWYEHRDTAAETKPAGFDRLLDAFRRVRL